MLPGEEHGHYLEIFMQVICTGCQYMFSVKKNQMPISKLAGVYLKECSYTFFKAFYTMCVCVCVDVCVCLFLHTYMYSMRDHECVVWLVYSV